MKDLLPRKGQYDYVNFETPDRDIRKWVVVQVFIGVADTVLTACLLPFRLSRGILRVLTPHPDDWKEDHSN